MARPTRWQNNHNCLFDNRKYIFDSERLLFLVRIPHTRQTTTAEPTEPLAGI